MLFCDATNAPNMDPSFPSYFRDPWITFAPALDAGGPVTLADVLAQNKRVVSDRGRIDLKRHRGRVNVAFADGHVEALATTPAALSSVLLTAQ